MLDIGGLYYKLPISMLYSRVGSKAWQLGAIGNPLGLMNKGPHNQHELKEGTWIVLSVNNI